MTSKPVGRGDILSTETTDSKPAAVTAGKTAAPPKKSTSPKKRQVPTGMGEGESRKKARASISGSEQLTFPERLMQLINDTIAPDYVGWIEKEEAISFKTDGFQEHVLDSFFQGLKYDSFVRKLNRWYAWTRYHLFVESFCRFFSYPNLFILALFGLLLFNHHRGFRRVTSDNVPDGFVAYYHNSFRKDEQHLLRSMGIGKKNDPAVRDTQAFAGEQSMIGSASAATTAVAAATASPVTQNPSLFSGMVASPTMAPAHPSGAYSIGSLTAAAAALPSSPAAQESKSDVAGVSVAQGSGQQDLQQVLLEAMLARQRQADLSAAIQHRQTAMLAESLRHQQSQQQQQRVSALSSALLGQNDTLARQLTLLAAHHQHQQQTQLFQPPRQLVLPGQQQQGRALNSDPALALLLQDYLQRQNISATAAAALPSANLAAATAGGVANRAAAAAPNPTANDILQALILEEQRRREAQGQGQSPGPAPPRR